MPQSQAIVATSRPDRILEQFRPKSANVDIEPSEIPEDIWTDITNFYMRPGFASRINGVSQFFDNVTTQPQNLINVRAGTLNWWVYMGNDGIQAVDQSNNVFDITPAIYVAPIVASRVNSTIINNFPVQSFQQDPPTFWDKIGGNICQPLPGWPAQTIAKSIRSFKFFLFALNIEDSGNEFPDALLWSDAAEPGAVPTEWIPSPANQAGTTQLSATSGGIVDALALRGSFMIYKNHSTYTCNFTGGTFVFAFRKLFTTSGILANNCVTEAEGSHVVLTDGDVIIHDGQNLRSLVDRRMRRFIFDQIDPDNFEASFVFNYRSAKEVWICFPTVGFSACNLAVVWNYAHNMLSIRNLPEVWSHAVSGTVLADAGSVDWDTQTETWNIADGNWNRAQFTGAFERALAAVPISPEDGNSRLLFVDDSNSNRDETAIGAQITRESLDLNAPEAFKYIRRVWPRITGSTGTLVGIRIGTQTHPTSGISWSAIQQFRVNIDEFLNFDAAGRYISVRFEEDSGPTAPVQSVWQVHGFDLEYTLQGEF